MAICEFCDEPVYDDPHPESDSPLHRECLLRMVAGSVGHQQQQCACYGLDDHTEDNITRREAARRAAEFFKGQVLWKRRN